MTNIFKSGLIAALLIFSHIVTSSAATPSEPPTAEQIVKKAVEQSRRSEAKLATSGYICTKLTETEKLDEKGRIKERNRNFYEMLFKSGALSKKRVLAPGETKAEAKRNKSSDEGELKLGKFKPTNRGDYINVLTPEVIEKYIFTLVDRIDLNGRSAFVVAFEPKNENLPGKELAERVLNKVEGKLWIDAEEFELAKAHVHMDSEITVGGGLLGSLKRAAFMIERSRLPGGIWFDRSTKTDYEARKLTESTRVITKSETRNFQKLSTEG